jgi:photosystem II stability/assembly factor-like uncharacterized protein
MRPTLLTLSICLILHGQTISPVLFGGLKWRSIGPFRGGRAVAVTGVPGGGTTFYFGAVDGGIWKSTDAGSVWIPIFDSQPVASIGALEVAPSDPNVIYAGTGESDIRSDLASGNGVYKSTDGGNTWQHIGLDDTRQISRIVVNPRDPNQVFVAALGHAYGPNEERGVFRSDDGGASWQKVLYRGPNVGAADLAMAPDEPRILFAALWEAHRVPWSVYAPVQGNGSGLFRSQDGGNTWTQLTGHGLPDLPWGRVGVAVARGTGGRRVYAILEAKQSGLYRSDDGGATWTLVNHDPRITERAWYFNCITVDPNDPDIVYIPNVAFYKLSNGGRDLTIVRGAPGGDDYHQVWIDPANSLHMVLGTDQGTTVTLNGGKTWSTWYNQPTGQFYHVITDNETPYHVYGAQQDSGTAATASSTLHNQIDLRDWFTVGGSESGYIAPDPHNPNIFYVSGTYGELTRFDRRTYQSQNIAPWPIPNDIHSDIAKWKYRDPWTPVLVFSPLMPNVLYYGTQYVMRSLDGGLHWQRISPDLTGAKPGVSPTPSPASMEEAKQQGRGVVYTIAPSPLNAQQIWAGSDTGLIHLTRDGGRTWTDVTPPNLTPWSKITQIEASHFVAGEAYAAVDRHRLDDMRPYLYRTRDFGKTWTPIVDGIASHAFLNAIREDPERKGLLFAGTEFGVYVSFDDGDSWLPLQLNLPVTSVRDAVIHNNDLIIATHGRGFWVLDNITPLRQISSDTAASDAILFKPARALRLVSDSFPGTPLPPDEPQAKNPPNGAYIDYYLRSAAQGAVTLDILDAHGNLVRHDSSAEKPPQPPTNVPIAPRWFPTPQILSGEPGMHRFIWDLRYNTTSLEAPPAAAGDETHWAGPLVLPGVYTVKLTVNGRALTQKLTIALDPRDPATPAELAQQFHWGKLAFEKMATARRAVREIQALQSQSDALKGKLPPNAQRLADALTNTSKQAGDILTGGTQGPEQGLEYASRGLTVALTAIESADRTPPSQVIELYAQSAKLAASRLAQWQKLKVSLAQLNRELSQVGLQPVDLSEH